MYRLKAFIGQQLLLKYVEGQGDKLALECGHQLAKIKANCCKALKGPWVVEINKLLQQIVKQKQSVDDSISSAYSLKKIWPSNNDLRASLKIPFLVKGKILTD